MAIIKETEQDVHVLSDGQLQCRVTTILMEDGEELSRIPHRYVIDVGDDVSNESQMVQDIAATVHTPERIAAREAATSIAV